MAHVPDGPDDTHAGPMPGHRTGGVVSRDALRIHHERGPPPSLIPLPRNRAPLYAAAWREAERRRPCTVKINQAARLPAFWRPTRRARG